MDTEKTKVATSVFAVVNGRFVEIEAGALIVDGDAVVIGVDVVKPAEKGLEFSLFRKMTQSTNVKVDPSIKSARTHKVTDDLHVPPPAEDPTTHFVTIDRAADILGISLDEAHRNSEPGPGEKVDLYGLAQRILHWRDEDISRLNEGSDRLRSELEETKIKLALAESILAAAKARLPGFARATGEASFRMGYHRAYGLINRRPNCSWDEVANALNGESLDGPRGNLREMWLDRTPAAA